MSTTDNVMTADEVFADVSSDGDIGTPVYPCLKCGAETKPHHTPAGSRICADKRCRYVLDDAVLVATSKARGDAIRPIVIPCAECGKPTKEHHTPAGARICSGRACRVIQAR